MITKKEKLILENFRLKEENSELKGWNTVMAGELHQILCELINSNRNISLRIGKLLQERNRIEDK